MLISNTIMIKTLYFDCNKHENLYDIVIFERSETALS